ncbi:arsenate reductase family protein [Maribacter chungangensis]|uniref:Arsenate reductase family protein n=1 Tax=Maribacter chungangensis TaxID=1069117 RepID=A0ABW3B575_9FLAO
MISKHDRKLTIYYHSGTSIGEQTLAYANASDKKIHAVDISKTDLTGTQWAELANGLGKNISDLINTDHPDFIKLYGNQNPEMEEHDWLKILEKELHLLKHPIVVFGERYLEIKSAAGFKKYLEPDSAGLKKQPLSKQFTDDDVPDLNNGQSQPERGKE